MVKKAGALSSGSVRASVERYSPCRHRRDFERGLTSRHFVHTKCERRKSPCYKKQMNDKDDLKSLSDDELLRCLSEVLAQSRRVEWVLVAHIAEVDARRLYASEGWPSMFQYCLDALHLAFIRVGSLSTHRSSSPLTPLPRAPKDARGWAHPLGRHLGAEKASY